MFDQPYEVYDGYHRVFMYIDDFIPTLANVCERFKAGEVYNIGGEDYRSVRELSDLILAHLGKDDSHITYLPEDFHNVQNKRPDITRARVDLGHDPQTRLEDGVPRTIEWMQGIYAGHAPEAAPSMRLRS
jgi:dTDP-glucose 4,6-dehydratase